MAEEGDRDLAAALRRSSGENAPITPERTPINRRVPIEHLSPIRATRAGNFFRYRARRAAASIKERGIIQPVVVRAVRGSRDAYGSSPAAALAGAKSGLHDVRSCRSATARRRSSLPSSRTCSAAISIR